MLINIMNKLYLLLFITLFIGCTIDPQPPIAKVIPDTTYIHNVELIDNYAWLKDKTRKQADVLEYINAENEYTLKVMKKTEKLQQSLYHEFINRIKETDVSVPIKKDNYFLAGSSAGALSLIIGSGIQASFIAFLMVLDSLFLLASRIFLAFAY